MHMIRLRREFGFNSDLSARGECEIQFQDYSEAIVVSMVILEFQATGPLGLVLCNRKRTLKLMVSAQGECEVESQG
ncbi:Glutamate Receptor 4 [Manis pentadactyla]|nr:Glutamate Receptor 4 [Manis pentadactyla]